MQKAIIVTGNQGSGKTTKIKELVSQIPANQVVWINPEKLELQINEALKADTTAVVIDGIISGTQLFKIQEYAKNGINVSKNNEEPQIIFPQIIVSTAHLTSDDLSIFQNDFEILEIAYQAAQNLGVTHQVVQDLGVKTSVFKVIDLASMSATLDRFYEGYIDSRISENDSQEERKKYSNDYFDFKRLLKSIPDDQD